MAKQTFTTGQVLTAAQMTSLQQTAMLGGAASAKTASYTLVAADAGTAITMSNASATTITVNTALFAAGDTVQITNLGAGVCTITAGTATVNTSASLALAQYESGTLDFTSTSAAIFIKGAGAAGSSFSGVACTAYNDISIANNTSTILTWNTESFDTDTYHSTATNTSRITIPTGKTGKFLLHAAATFQTGSTGFREFDVLKNGVLAYRVYFQGNDFTNPYMQLTTIISAAAADYYEVRVRQNNGGALSISGTSSQAGCNEFSLVYLGA